MIFFQSQLDDVPIPDGMPSFDGGQVSNMRANLLAENQASELINYDISSTGEAILRRGTVQLGGVISAGTYIQGLSYLDTPSLSYPLAVNNAHVFFLSGSTWTVLSGYAAASTLVPVTMVQGINKIYLCDGVGNVFSLDGVTYVNLGNASNTQPPAAPKALIWFTSRLIAAGILAEPDAIYFSNLLDGSTWNKTTQQIRVGGGEADLITGLVPWTNNVMAVLKKNSLWRVSCVDSSGAFTTVGEFTVDRIHATIGCMAPRTACQVGSDIFLLTTSGVRSLQRTLASEQQNQITDSLSWPVQDIIERINQAAIATCCAIYWNNRYILALPLDQAVSPDTLLVWNNLTKSWSGTWTGLNVVAFGIRQVASDSPRLIMGLGNGKVVDWQDYVAEEDETDVTFQDSGVNTPSRVKGRALTFSEQSSPKTGLNAEFEFNKSKATVSAYVVLDDSDPVLIDSFSSGFTNGLDLPFDLPFDLPKVGVERRPVMIRRFGRFRELQFVLTTASKKVRLRSFQASAFQDTTKLTAP